MNGKQICGLILALALWGQCADAADVLQAKVEHVNGVYRVEFEAHLDAEPERVRKIATNYEKLQELSPTVLESRIVSQDSGRVRVDLLLKACVWKIFCRRMRKVTDAMVSADGSILHRTVASESDFSYAEEQLWINAGAGQRGTLARYNAELVPKFFVPPVVGPWLIRRQIISELTKTAQAIESAALR